MKKESLTPEWTVPRDWHEVLTWDYIEDGHNTVYTVWLDGQMEYHLLTMTPGKPAEMQTLTRDEAMHAIMRGVVNPAAADMMGL